MYVFVILFLPQGCAYLHGRLVLMWFHKAWNKALTLGFFLIYHLSQQYLFKIYFPHWFEMPLLFGSVSEQRPWTFQYTMLPFRTGEFTFLYLSISSSVNGARELHYSSCCYFAARYALIHQFQKRAWVLCGAGVCAKHWEYKRNEGKPCVVVMSVSQRQLHPGVIPLSWDRSLLCRKVQDYRESGGCWAKWSW